MEGGTFVFLKRMIVTWSGNGERAQRELVAAQGSLLGGIHSLCLDIITYAGRLRYEKAKKPTRENFFRAFLTGGESGSGEMDGFFLAIERTRFVQGRNKGKERSGCLRN